MKNKQSVTMVGGRNVSTPPPKTTKTKTPEPAEPEKPTEPEKDSETQ